MSSMKQNSKIDNANSTEHGRNKPASQFAKVMVPRADKKRPAASGETGERIPKKVTASDMSGEKRERIVGGVALGKADRMYGRDKSHIGKHEGAVGEHNTGVQKSGMCYEHERLHYRREDREVRGGEN